MRALKGVNSVLLRDKEIYDVSSVAVKTGNARRHLNKCISKLGLEMHVRPLLDAPFRFAAVRETKGVRIYFDCKLNKRYDFEVKYLVAKVA